MLTTFAVHQHIEPRQCEVCAELAAKHQLYQKGSKQKLQLQDDSWGVSHDVFSFNPLNLAIQNDKD